MILKIGDKVSYTNYNELEVKGIITKIDPYDIVVKGPVCKVDLKNQGEYWFYESDLKLAQ